MHNLDIPAIDRRSVFTTSIYSSCSKTMASNDSSSNRSDSPGSISSGEEDYGVVRLRGFAPYQDEPLAVAGQPAFHFEEDKDGIPHAVLAARQEQRIVVDDWYVLLHFLCVIHNHFVLFLFFIMKNIVVNLLGRFRIGTVWFRPRRCLG